jgi:hypothetical protein
MAAAYQHYIFYYATGRPVPYLERIADQTLSLQQPDGLFAPGKAGGEPCQDLDPVDILANVHRQSDYRRADLEAALGRAVVALVANQRPGGAFVYAHENDRTSLGATLGVTLRPRWPPDLRTRLQALGRYMKTELGPQKHYAGCVALPFHPGEGDMFSQWFRPLALAIASAVLGLESSPVWCLFGFRRQITQGWWPAGTLAATFLEKRSVE